MDILHLEVQPSTSGQSGEFWFSDLSAAVDPPKDSDQTVRLKNAQGFAHSRPSNPKFVEQDRLGREHFARRNRASGDLGADLLGHGLAGSTGRQSTGTIHGKVPLLCMTAASLIAHFAG